MNLLEVKDLSVTFDTDERTVGVLDNVCIDVKPGETLGIVGESGCGKSVTSLSIMRLLPQPAGKITNGSVFFDGQDLLSLSKEDMRTIRGRKIAMIFQEPMTALNPVQRVGVQMMESLKLHRSDISKEEQRQECEKRHDRVGIPEPRLRLTEYPHQLSGGMRQRVMIAMALLHVPDILIADEPTTALDVTIQAQILELIAELQKQSGMSVIFITHDLAVIAEISDRVVVMYAGRVVEQAKIKDLFENPRHPYTRGLLGSIPTLDGTPKTPLSTIPGMVPSFADMPSGCRFRNRCDYAQERCKTEVPALKETGGSHAVACHYWQHVAQSTST